MKPKGCRMLMLLQHQGISDGTNFVQDVMTSPIPVQKAYKNSDPSRASQKSTIANKSFIVGY